MKNCLLYFRGQLLETVEDVLSYSFQYFFRSHKFHIFRKKILDTLGDA
jgi:hypothetical protein